MVHRDNQSFALKLLKDEHRRNAVQQARLVNEAEALRVLDIPGVVQVFGDGDFEGRPYYVMEYLPTTLAERIGKPLLPSQIVPVIEMLARILAELHARGYVHRDLKPRNILFAPDGSLRLADFGLAKLPIDQLAVVPHSTATGAFLGTHAYAAPEQLLNAKSVDGRADVYALGLILFEALAGRPPFPAENAEELAHLRLTTRAPRLLSPLVTLSPQLVSLVAQMLERAHDRRPSAHEVLERLASVPLTHAPTLPRRRFAALLMLPLFLSDPFADMFREKPDARVAEPLSAHPHEVAPPQTAKELFAAFGIALDAGTMEEASALLLRAESLPVTPELEGKLLQKQADMARELGQLNQAQQLYRKARQHFLQPNSLRNWAACAIREADMWLHLGDMDAARELYEEAAHYHSVVLAKKALAEIPVGGKTPLSAGLFTAYQVFDQEKRLHPDIMPLMILLTDGAGNVSMSDLPPQEEAHRIADQIREEHIRNVTINMEHAAFDQGLAQQLAVRLGGPCFTLADLRAETLYAAVKQQLDA